MVSGVTIYQFYDCGGALRLEILSDQIDCRYHEVDSYTYIVRKTKSKC